MTRRSWLYILGGVVLVGLMWLLVGGGGHSFRVVQPPEGLSPGTRFLQVRWKTPLKEAPKEGTRSFRIVPELPILSVSWVSPTEAILHLGAELAAGTTYTLIGREAPWKGEAKFFTQPIAVMQAEGGYLWGESASSYRQAVYLRTNAALSEAQLEARWGSGKIVRFVSLGRSEFLAVSDHPAQKPFSGELRVSYEGERIYEGELQAEAYGNYELRRAEIDFEGGRYFVRLRGNRPILTEASQVAAYVGVESGVEIAELEARGIEVRIYLGQLPTRSFEVYLRSGFPDGAQGFAEAETLLLSPPPANALAWAQSNVHYVAQGQGLHFVVGPKTQNLRVRLWRVRPENERLFFQEVESYYFFDPGKLNFYGTPVLHGDFPVDVFPRVHTRGGLITRALGKELDPGTYCVELSPQDVPWQSISTWFVVSDWYLLSREWEKSLWVAALDKVTGQPLSGVRVTVVSSDGMVLREGRTGGTGAVVLELSPLRPAHAVIAEWAGRSLFLPLGKFRPLEWPYPTDGFDPHQRSYHLYLTGARTLYRPGDTIRLHGYLRTHDWKYPKNAPTLRANLQDSRAQTIFTTTLSLDENAQFALSYPLPRDAVTGTYQIQVVLDANSSRSVKADWPWVQDEKEDQGEKKVSWEYPLQVEVFRGDRMVIEGQVLSMASKLFLNVGGRYLYGAVASFQKGEVSAELRSAAPETPLAQGYNWEVRLPSKLKEEFLRPTEIQTDADGQAKIPLPSFQGLGLVELNTRMILYDEESRPNSLRRSFRIPTQPILVGVRRDARWVNSGEPLTLSLRALGGPDYTGLARGTHAIDVEVWEVTYDYNLFQSYYDQYRTDYRARRRRFLRTKVEIREGNGEITFTPRTGGTYEVLLWAPGQVEPTFYEVEVWGWGSTALKGPPEGQVLIQPQDSAARAGQKVTLLLKAPLPGKALLTIEREKVWHHQWVDLAQGSATITLKLPESYAPGVYVHVVAFHAVGDKTVPFASSRGMLYLPVIRSQGVASLTLKVPPRTKPGVPLKLRIEASRHPGSYILLTGLDEGVWSKQVHKPQAPEEVFYQKWAHLVSVSEHLPLVASWGKEVIGGGDLEADGIGYDKPGNASLLTAEAYEHTMAFERLLKLNDRGVAEVSLVVPAFSGKIRWRAYLVDESVYGSAEAFTLVAAPVIGRMGVPFYMAGGEEVETNLVLRNTTDQPQTGTWRIAVSSGELAITPSRGVFSLAVGGVQTIKLRYKAVRPWGLSTVALYVNEDLAQERQVRIRPAAAPRLLTEAMRMRPGMDTVLHIPAEFFQNPQEEAHLIVSSAPIHELGPAVVQLLRFPHGCAEQITSQAFVSLKLGDLAAALHAASADTVRKHVQYVLGRLPLYRTGSGFGFWPGSSEDTWLTLHICHFLIEASQAGYQEANPLLSSLREFLERMIRQEHPHSYYAAYSAFLLARQKGSQVASLLPSVKVAEGARDPVVRAFWRAAFKLARVSILPAQLSLTHQESDDLDYYHAMPDLRYWYAESFVEPSAVPAFFRERLSMYLRKPYLSTHEALWSLLAYQQLYARQGKLSGRVEIGSQSISLGGTVWSQSLRLQGARKLRLKADRETLYVFLWAESYPVNSSLAVSRGLGVTEEIIPKGGRQYVWRIRLRQTSTETLENVALTVPYPSGFMLDRSTLSEESRYPTAQGLSWDYTDLREDRFLGYFRMTQKEAQIELPIRLIYPGRYQIPAMSVMVMYVPTIYGATAARAWEFPSF